MQEVTARERLEAMCPRAQPPALTDVQFELMVALAKRPDPRGNRPDGYPYWESATAYGFGLELVPTIRNRHLYQVTVAGTSGANEPNWPTADEATVVDGTVTWKESGVAPWEPTWDLNVGAAAGWRMKAGNAAQLYEFSDTQSRFARNQLIDHCMSMVRLYLQGTGASIRLTTDLANPTRWPRVLGN